MYFFYIKLLFNGHKYLPHKITKQIIFWRNIILIEKSFQKLVFSRIAGSDPEVDQDPYQNETDPKHC